MKIKVQKTEKAFIIQESCNLTELFKKHRIKKEESGAVVFAVEYLLECFPRFKEIIINTELTEDVQANIKD